MIVLPRRSVTRFFIPMIDVLILLFCAFLLMPFSNRTDAGTASGHNSDPAFKESIPIADGSRLRVVELCHGRILP